MKKQVSKPGWRVRICICVLCLAGLVSADVRLPPILSDHMVLLKADHVPVWGWADAGEPVSVTLNGQAVTTTAGSDGTWRVDLNLDDSPPGPFEMVVQGNNTIQIDDVVVGEVWLGSGQSNMEQMVVVQKHAEEETLTADNPMIRQFIVVKTASMNPRDDVDGFWLKVSPGQTDTMSALGYYFSKEIHRATKQPVGIIKASWGGKPIQPFISPEVYDLDENRRGDRAQSRGNALARADAFYGWLDETGRTDRSGIDREPFINGPVSDSDGWVKVNDSGPINPSLPEYGANWFRRDIPLMQSQREVPQYLYIGMRDVHFFSVYFNGRLVEQVDRDDYTRETGLTTRIHLTPEVMKAGVNNLALRIFSPHKPAIMAWAPQLNSRRVAGQWWGKAEYGLPGLPGSVPANPIPVHTVPCALFDGMIRPLVPFSLRGVLWYQGESNTSNPASYREQMPLLINSWRTEWGAPDMPFYYCQLANYLEKQDQPGESQWAELREAQLMTLSVPNTGMAVLIDTGESQDIHPQSKDIAGERMARIALANVYGQSIPYSGPIYESMSIEGNRLRLTFSHVEGGLVAQELPDTYWVRRWNNTTAPLVRNSPDSQLEGFSIRGADTPWVWADASIDEDTVLVWSDDVPHPVEVRYAWADNPTCNLYNQAGLPASPFRADVPIESGSLLFSLISRTPHPPSGFEPCLFDNFNRDDIRYVVKTKEERI